VIGVWPPSTPAAVEGVFLHVGASAGDRRVAVFATGPRGRTPEADHSASEENRADRRVDHGAWVDAGGDREGPIGEGVGSLS
jgi:hypothetical protein